MSEFKAGVRPGETASEYMARIARDGIFVDRVAAEEVRLVTNAKPKELSVDEMWARIIETKNVLDRTAKPTPRRHTGPLKDLLLGIVIGAAIMVALFLLGWAEAAL